MWPIKKARAPQAGFRDVVRQGALPGTSGRIALEIHPHFVQQRRECAGRHTRSLRCAGFLFDKCPKVIDQKQVFVGTGHVAVLFEKRAEPKRRLQCVGCFRPQVGQLSIGGDGRFVVGILQQTRFQEAGIQDFHMAAGALGQLIVG